MQNLQALIEPATAAPLTDADITAAVELFFLTKKGVSGHLIDVTTHDGIVQLTGITDSLLSRERAEEIALALRGVRGVVNEIVVSTAHVPDFELQRHVSTALNDDPATSGYYLGCKAADGIVTVTGTVQSWAEKQLVLRVLHGVRGVRRVVADELTIRWGEIDNTDDEISTQIRELLDWDIRVYSSLVTIHTAERVVYLSGSVGTAAEKNRVVSTAFEAGATRVEARDLEVAYWALSSQLRRDKYADRPDEAIAHAVLDAFRYDPEVLSYQPTVLVHRGVVTLTGTVSNLRAKQRAEYDARHIVGVWDVHNLLKVRTSRFIPDDSIRQTVKEALARNPYVGTRDLAVTVTNGKVYLYGQVSSPFEQEQAGTVAAGVNGVSEVSNWLGVPGHTPFTDNSRLFWNPAAPHPTGYPIPDFALAERIRTRYGWSVGLHDQDVDVSVESGRVTLTGTVDTWLDRKEAATDAYEAGARDVNNHLHVTTLPL